MRLKGRRQVVAAKPAATTPAPPPTQDLEAAWAEGSALFANRRGMKLSGLMFAGLPERLLPNRFAKLVGHPRAKRAAHLLGLLSDRDLRIFQARAAIGLEQVVAAMRLFLVFNVSGPVGLVLLIGALLPEDVVTAYLAQPGALLGGFVAAAVALPLYAWLIWYAFAGVHQARDLYHLATIEMAKRGLAATVGAAEQNPTEARP